MCFINASCPGVDTLYCFFLLENEYIIKMNTNHLRLSPLCLVLYLCIIKYYNLVITAVSYLSIFVQVTWGRPQVFAFCLLPNLAPTSPVEVLTIREGFFYTYQPVT